ncbi:MAG: glycosyltransferase family 39 protein [bacterium]|nr:glycosyltransferase family 39 protein [bacterium]
MYEFIKKHNNIFILAGLLLVCFFVYFCGIGNYPLMDVDETRYVSMARDMFKSQDFMTLYLNGEYFFEKPPLFFWSEVLSFGLFGHVNEYTARFAVAFYALIVTLFVYFTGKKVVSKRFGLVSALILATMIEFTILARYAILDIVLAALVGCSVLSGFLTQFVETKNQKYFWWLFYIFSGLAVLAKGIPGFVIPFGVIFFVCIFNKTFKKIFRPSCIIPGIILFLLIVLPWHIIMLKMHNPLFYDEYIVKHHLNRFFSSDQIGRGAPFYFYFHTLLWGTIPYVLSAIAIGITKIFNWEKIEFGNMTNGRKFLWFNIIAFVFTFLFFSVSSTKLVTYILPIYIFIAYILGFLWTEYIFENKYEKPVNISSWIIGIIFLIAFVASLFMKYYLPEQIYLDIRELQWFCGLLLLLTGSGIVLSLIKKNRLAVFASLVIFMTILSAFGTKMLFNFNYKFGQQDLMEFTIQEKSLGHDIYVINSPRKYSVLYYGDKAKYVRLKKDSPRLSKYDKIYDKNSRVIVKNKDFEDLSRRYNLDVLKTGRKYSVVIFKK